ncbi:MAG: hypothetical protein CM15mP107_4920 [Bacteroidota bacterium]|nr:MAG: hypothetical protein CM15mP107_4920 [Bacteroidota bacterium]
MVHHGSGGKKGPNDTKGRSIPKDQPPGVMGCLAFYLPDMSKEKLWLPVYLGRIFYPKIDAALSMV